MTTHAMLNRTTKATLTKITGAPLLKWLAAFCVLNSVSATESRPEPSELQVLVRQEVAHLRGEIEAQVQELLRRGEFESQVLRQELLELRACTGCMPPPLPPSPPSPSPSLSPSPPIDFILVLDESGSMRKPRPFGSMEGPMGLKSLAKLVVYQFALGADAARFSVVSFASDATTRVPWSYDAGTINAGIDQMWADGQTSISDAFEAAGQLFADDGREDVAKFVLFISDGEQTVDAKPGKTLLQTAVDAAALVKGDGVTVFAWGIGKARLETLESIATDPSRAILAEDVGTLGDYVLELKAAVCNGAPFPNL